MATPFISVAAIAAVIVSDMTTAISNLHSVSQSPWCSERSSSGSSPCRSRPAAPPHPEHSSSWSACPSGPEGSTPDGVHDVHVVHHVPVLEEVRRQPVARIQCRLHRVPIPKRPSWSGSGRHTHPRHPHRVHRVLPHHHRLGLLLCEVCEDRLIVELPCAIPESACHPTRGTERGKGSVSASWSTLRPEVFSEVSSRFNSGGRTRSFSCWPPASSASPGNRPQ